MVVPTIRASDLSGLSCRPFFRYHCLTSVVHSARTDSPAGVLIVGAHGKMELGVVGVLVILYAVVSDDVGDWLEWWKCRRRSKKFGCYFWSPYGTLMVIEWPNHIASPFSRFLVLINLNIESKVIFL